MTIIANIRTDVWKCDTQKAELHTMPQQISNVGGSASPHLRSAASESDVKHLKIISDTMAAKVAAWGQRRVVTPGALQLAQSTETCRPCNPSSAEIWMLDMETVSARAKPPTRQADWMDSRPLLPYQPQHGKTAWATRELQNKHAGRRTLTLSWKGCRRPHPDYQQNGRAHQTMRHTLSHEVVKGDADRELTLKRSLDIEESALLTRKHRSHELCEDWSLEHLSNRP